MNSSFRHSRIHCFEVRADGSIVKPAIRADDAEDLEALHAPPGPLSIALFDGLAAKRDRALLALLRGL